MPTSTLPRRRIAAPANTSSSPSTWGLVAACIRDNVSGNLTTPIAAVSASVEPPSTSTPATMSSDAHRGFLAVARVRCRARGSGPR